MKKNELIKNMRWTGLTVAFVSILVASVAFADVTPVVSVVVKNQSNATTTTANIGTVVHASTEVASSTGPVALGTVDFKLYPNTSCTGTATTESGVLLASGLANSATTTLGASGLSYKVHYNGQVGVYNPADSNCFSVSATSGSVGINTTLSSSTVTVGTSVFQSSTLTNATSNATGTVAYKIYTNSACTLGEQSAGIKTVTNALVPNSDSTVMNVVGTLYFHAKYSGDMNNSEANSLCRPVSVLATSSTPTPPPAPPPPPPTPGAGSISGISFNDLNKNRVKDGGENGVSGFTVKLYGGTFWWNWGKMSPIKTTTTDTNGNYSFSGLSDGLYQIEEVRLTGWKQLSSDFKWVLLINGSNLTGLNFANVQIGSTTVSTSTPNTKADQKKEEKEIRKQEKEEKKGQKKEEKQLKKRNKQLEKIQKLFEKYNKKSDKDEDDD